MKKIFVIDDSIPTLKLIHKILDNSGYTVFEFSDASTALSQIKTQAPDLIIMDIEMPKMNGLEALQLMKRIDPDLKVVIMTAYADLEKIHYFLENGVIDFIAKPFSLNEINTVLAHVFSDENDKASQELYDKRLSFICKSPEITNCIDKALKVCNSDLPILILGENGTGKEILADFIHYNSLRKYNNMIKVNCAAIPGDLAESELFGHERGAFTGAVDTRQGKIELSNKGTLFLDEIGDLSPNLQTKLLRVLEYKKYERVGGKNTIETDFRLICASNKNLNDEVEKGNFRQDLFYRINTVTLKIPPLRERKSDIEPLIHHFLKQYRKKFMVTAEKISKEALAILEKYEWSGNVRELKNVIETTASLTVNDTIQPCDLPRYIYDTESRNTFMNFFESDEIVPLDELEKAYIKSALRKLKGNKKKTAEKLGISEKTLYNKLSKYHI